MQDAIGDGLAKVNDSLGNVIFSPGAVVPKPPFPSDGDCVHFWLIETPNGPTSQGTCKNCGKVQLFRNSVSSSTWNRGVGRHENEWL